jgi:hypothetical protein
VFIRGKKTSVAPITPESVANAANPLAPLFVSTRSTH